MVNNVKTSKYLKTGMSEVLLILYNNNTKSKSLKQNNLKQRLLSREMHGTA